MEFLFLARNCAREQNEAAEKDNDHERHNSHEGSDDAQAPPAAGARPGFIHARAIPILSRARHGVPPADGIANCGGYATS